MNISDVYEFVKENRNNSYFLAWHFLLRAVSAFSVEENRVGINSSRNRLRQKLTCITNHADRKINDVAAGFANEVVMRGGRIIKVYRSVSAGEADDLA